MTYPPSVPPNTRADNTPLPTNHIADHNDISNALTDIINELGSDPSGAAASLTARLDGATDYVAISSPVTVLTTATTVASLTLNGPAAGLGAVVLSLSLAASGVTFGGAGNGAAVTWSITGVTEAPARIVSPDDSIASNTTITKGALLVVLLASGSNTITLKATRTNGSGTSGGTINVTGYVSAVGMF